MFESKPISDCFMSCAVISVFIVLFSQVSGWPVSPWIIRSWSSERRTDSGSTRRRSSRVTWWRDTPVRWTSLQTWGESRQTARFCSCAVSKAPFTLYVGPGKLPEWLLCERKHVPGLIPGLIPGWGPSNIAGFSPGTSAVWTKAGSMP